MEFKPLGTVVNAVGHSEENKEVSDQVDDKNFVDDETGLTVVESLCMECRETGSTRMLFIRIPFFREIVVSSFECPHCGEKNCETQFGGEIQEQGIRYELTLDNQRDINRQVVKSDWASITFPSIEFEIPPISQRAQINTVEGFLKRAAEDLSALQPERALADPEVALKVAAIILKLREMADGDTLPFRMIVDDPSGNSFVENPMVPAVDEKLTISHYSRSKQQNIQLGLDSNDSNQQETNFKDPKLSGYQELIDKTSSSSSSTDENDNGLSNYHDLTANGRKEILKIPSPCPHCLNDGEELTFVTNIPHFKEIIIMSFDCDACGYRTNEIKAGGAIPSFGTQVDLLCEGPIDLCRDLLKSDSCQTVIPSLELELDYGTLGGVFTSVEGLLKKIRTNFENMNPFKFGDSCHADTDSEDFKFSAFFAKLNKLCDDPEYPFHVILRDPLGNSFIGPRSNQPDLKPKDDTLLTISDFVRTFEENEIFGLNDMKTNLIDNGYQQESDDDNSEVVLSDMMSNPHTKGLDHPNAFAKGCNDQDGK